MKAVLFDIGRVLIHYEHAVTLRAMAGFCGADEETLGALMLELEPDFQRGRMDRNAYHTHFVQRVAAPDDFDAFCAAFSAGHTRNDEALAYALELEQRPDVLVGVISNTNEIHVDWLDENLPELDQFDLVMMSSEVGMTKPDPALFRLALDLLEVPPDRALFIDDMEEYVAGARAIGMAAIVHRDWAETRPLLEEWLRSVPD